MSSFGNISNSGYKDKKKYKKWRDSVIARYNNTCATCGVKEKSLHSHHIVPWSEDELLRYESENGVALCKNCHSIIHGFEIYCKKNILKDLNNIKNIRQKYVDVCNIKFKRG
jgi:predicted HNH restriction endonuclease